MKRWMFGVAGLWLVWAWSAGAQPYPSKHITLIVPYPAGGISDTSGRAVANNAAVRFNRRSSLEIMTGGSQRSDELVDAFVV